MSKAKLLAIKAARLGHGQVEISNAGPCPPEVEWDDFYVNLSGYCGTYNPHLFAAAPELLEALKALLAPYQGAFSNDQHLHGCDLSTIEKAFAVIAKAEGRQS